jgi:hypothetical protein
MEFLSSWLAGLSSLKYCNTFKDPSFFGAIKIGELYLDWLGWIIPILSYSWIWVYTEGLCASGIEYCFEIWVCYLQARCCVENVQLPQYHDHFYKAHLDVN